MLPRRLFPALVGLGFGLAGTTPAQTIPVPGPPKAPRAPVAPLPEGATAPAPGPLLKATLVTHVQAGRQPTTCAIADGGRTLLVTNRGDNSVSVFATHDMSTTKTITEVGYSAWGVVPRSGDQILVANWAGSSIAILDRASGRRLGEIPVGMKPSYLALSPDGKRVYSAGNFSDDATIADVASRKPLRSLEVGRRPMGVALSKDGTTLFVAAGDSKKITRIDAAGQSVVGTFGAALASTTNLVLTPDGRRLLAAGENGNLLVIDAATGDVQRVGIGRDASSVAVTPDGRVALVADYTASNVSLVDLAALAKYDAVPVGEGALHVETDGTRFYTCNDRSGSVSAYRLDPADGAVTR